MELEKVGAVGPLCTGALKSGPEKCQRRKKKKKKKKKPSWRGTPKLGAPGGKISQGKRGRLYQTAQTSRVRTQREDQTTTTGRMKERGGRKKGRTWVGYALGVEKETRKGKGLKR